MSITAVSTSTTPDAELMYQLAASMECSPVTFVALRSASCEANELVTLNALNLAAFGYRETCGNDVKEFASLIPIMVKLTPKAVSRAFFELSLDCMESTVPVKARAAAMRTQLETPLLRPQAMEAAGFAILHATFDENETPSWLHPACYRAALQLARRSSRDAAIGLTFFDGSWKKVESSVGAAALELAFGYYESFDTAPLCHRVALACFSSAGDEQRCALALRDSRVVPCIKEMLYDEDGPTALVILAGFFRNLRVRPLLGDVSKLIETAIGTCLRDSALLSFLETIVMHLGCETEATRDVERLVFEFARASLDRPECATLLVLLGRRPTSRSLVTDFIITTLFARRKLAKHHAFVLAIFQRFRFRDDEPELIAAAVKYIKARNKLTEWKPEIANLTILLSYNGVEAKRAVVHSALVGSRFPTTCVNEIVAALTASPTCEEVVNRVMKLQREAWHYTNFVSR